MRTHRARTCLFWSASRTNKRRKSRYALEMERSQDVSRCLRTRPRYEEFVAQVDKKPDMPLIMHRKAKGSPVHFKLALASASAPGIVKVDSVGQARCPWSHDQYATCHSVSARLGKWLRPNKSRQSDG